MEITKRAKYSNNLCSTIEVHDAGELKINTVNGLIERGADVNYQHNFFDGNTPLHLAVIKSDVDIVKLLLKHNADKTILNNDGKSAAELAIGLNNQDVIKLLNISVCRISLKMIRTVKYNNDGGHNSEVKNDFKILLITECPSKSEAIAFLSKQEFKDIFQKALDLFAILIEINSEEIDLSIDQLNNLFADQIMIIFQIKSLTSKNLQTYYKDEKSSGFRVLSNFEMHSQEHFPFETLFNQFGNHKFITDFSLNRIELFDGNNLLYQAVKSNEILCIRFLMLFKWNLHEETFSVNNPIHISLRSHSEKALSALLDLPLNGCENVFILTENQSNLIRMKDDRGCNFLIIAAEHRNSKIIQFLINLDFNINEKFKIGSNFKIASDIAWENRDFETLFQLLKNDSLLPKEFEQSEITNNDKFTELNNLLSERKLIHEKIENGEVENVKNFVNCHCQMKFCFDLENNSALKNALKKSKYEIFALLQSEGFLFGPDEDRDVLLKTLSDNEKKELRSANLKYFINPDNSHIEQLVSVSRLGFGLKNKENGFERIRGFYKELNEIKEVSPLLKIVANAQKVKIIFDFNANSVHNVDPTVSENVRGKAYFIDGHIYIGALRELPEVLGTLAHELCHIAMQMVFDNKCQPFRLENDQNNEETFREIVKKYDSDAIKLKDDIVNRVYTCSFTGEARAAELIVRVPHILAYYKGNNDKINEMKNNFTELFDYYYKLLESDLNEAHSSLEDRIFLKKFNKICGVYDQLEYILHCQEIIPIQLQNQLITIIKTNYPLMMMKNIKNHLETTEKNPQNSLQVFVSLEQFCDEKYSEQIDAIIKLNSRPMFFVAQTVAEHNKNLYFEQLMRKLKNSGIRMIFMIYLKSEIPMEDVDSGKIEIVFKWIDLKKFSQDKLLSQTVNFRGNLLAWKDIFNSQSETLQNLDIHEMNNRKNIFVDIDEKEVKSYLMTNIYISRTFNMEENNSSNIGTTKLNKDVLNEDQIIKCAEENKIILIADDAGNGKTTFLRHVRKKLAKNMPQCLVAMIDLKQYTLKFDNMSNEENIQTKLQNIFDISNEFDKKVFKEFLQTGKICLILDGFDEIDDKSRKLVLKFMEEFAALNMNQLWIGSRSHYKVKFAENLVKFSFKMLPFTNDDQRNFLVRFWSTENERSTMSLEEVAKDLIEKFASAYCRRGLINFSAIPLQLRMLAEIFKHNLSNNDYSQKVLLDSDKTNIYWFYDFFTSKVMENWVPSNPIPFDSGETIIERLQSLRQFHRDYAFKTIFLNIKVANKSMIENLALSNSFSEDLIVKFGILQRSTNSRLFEFSHQTFAEFYAIQYLLNEIMQKELNTEYFDFLCAAFIEIMMLHQKMIRSFLNAALKTKQFESIISNTTFLQTTKKHIFNQHSFKYNISLFLELFAMEYQEILMGFLLKIVGNDEEFVIELMQNASFRDNNCIINISKDADIDTLNVILLKFDNNKRLADLFLNECKYGKIALFHAALNKDCKVFKLLVEFLRGFQGEDFNIVSFLNRDDSQKRNVFHFTMLFARSVEILSNLLNNLKHFLPSKSMQKALFTHQNGQTRLYEILGSYRVSFEAFEMFWSFFCEVFNETERKKIFTESNHNGQNILTALAEKGDEVFIDYLLPDIFRTIGKKYFKLQVLLRDENGNNFLHKTAASKSVNGFESILIFMKQNFKIKELKQIFSAKNNFKENCFMRYKPRFTVSLPIIRLAESVLKAEDMKSFLKMKTAFGQNSLNYFVAFGTDEEFNAVWKMYRKHLSVDELKDIMLFQDTMENYPGFKMFTFYKKDIVIKRASSLQNYFVQVMILKKQYKQDS